MPADAAGRDFAGWLKLPRVTFLPGGTALEGELQGFQLWLVIRCAEPIIDVQLFLLVDPEFKAMTVTDAVGAVWAGTVIGEFSSNVKWRVVRFVRTAMPPGHDVNEPVAAIAFPFDIGPEVALLGIFGTTTSAVAAAAAVNAALSTTVAALGQQKASGVPTPAPGDTPGQIISSAGRTLLAPGRLYRLDVDVSWTGQVMLAGANPPVVNRGPQPFDRISKFFRTAPSLDPLPLLPPPGDPSRPKARLAGQSSFHPAMLERYLDAVVPADRTTAWFLADPLHVHFRFDHVALLAHSYGYGLGIGLRRSDAPPPQGGPYQLFFPLGWQFETSPSFVSSVADARRIELFSDKPCLPLPGAQASVAADLVGEAWYDVWVEATGVDPAPGQRRRDTVQLPATVFRTSRYKAAPELLADLNFSLDIFHAPGPHGDCAVATADIADVVVDDDAAFEVALEQLNLAPWPSARGGRSSLLWQRAAGDSWLLHGALIEAAEPIHRPNRLEIADFEAQIGSPTGPGIATITLPVRRRTRDGSRLFCLADTAFSPVPIKRIGAAGVLVSFRARLLMTATDKPPNAAPIVLRMALSMPGTPAFAEAAA